ncbi:MAG: hypothetical protein E2P02_11605 [Acidobacteria bacterium]|nr:MAG: hypothetical protein E2P02_11605 [Acidobacteriota bacterium]
MLVSVMIGKRVSGCLWFVVALFLTTCDTTTGPSEGITVYEHPNYGGSARTFDGSFNDLDVVTGPCRGFFDAPDRPGNWENCISSIRIPAGWEATLYEHDDYEGDGLIVTSDISDLDDVMGCGGDWDNCASSLQVRPPR